MTYDPSMTITSTIPAPEGRQHRAEITDGKYLREAVYGLKEPPQEETVEIIRMSKVDTQTVEWLWEPYIPFGKVNIVQGLSLIHISHIMDADLLMQTSAEVLNKSDDYSISNRAEFEALVKKNLATQQTDQTKKQQKRIPQITTRLEQIDKVLNLSLIHI